MNFARLAPHYDWMEALTAGQRLQHTRTAWLDALQDRRRILSVGEGHGRFAAACIARFPTIDLTVVEQCPRMLERARLQMAETGLAGASVRWQCADVLEWTPPARPFDAIVTCFFLDCFPPPMLAAVIAKLARCASPDAVWMLADFTLPEHGWKRWRAQAVHRLMYAFFRAAVGLPARRLSPPDDLLRQHGFQRAQHRELEWGLLRADVWRRT